MKKILFGILTFLGIGLSFCSAEIDGGTIDLCSTVCFTGNNEYRVHFNGLNDSYLLKSSFNHYISHTNWSDTETINRWYTDVQVNNLEYEISCLSFLDSSCNGVLGGGSSTSSDITIYYNNSQSSTDITCDGTQAIEIQGLSTITSTNTFTPYFNISYIDEDNQSLIESYSKDILYLENGQFKKTYTGNNDWILTVQGGSENSFSGYLPTFEITGGIEEVSESGNIFNNFAENSIKMTLSNIPSYIQYVIILMLLFFILGFIRKFRRK